MLTAADDRLHPPASADPWWTETAWFGFAVPAAGLCGSIYQIYRTNQGVMATAVYVWEPGREDLRQLPYHRAFWHLPIPDGAHPTDCDLPSGLTVRTEEPLHAYRLRYADGDEIALDLRFTGLLPPQPLHVSDGMGHLDQLGHVGGSLVLHGVEHEVDCVEMRDRSWTPRRETSTHTRRGYTYGATPDGTGFFVATSVPHRHPDGEAAPDAAVGGWVVADGVVTPIDAGERRVERDAEHRPARVTVEVEAGGATRRFVGEVASRLALPTTPYFAWMSLTRWRGDDGWEAWGEDHDSWSPARWRAFTRATVPA